MPRRDLAAVLVLLGVLGVSCRRPPETGAARAVTLAPEDLGEFRAAMVHHLHRAGSEHLTRALERGDPPLSDEQAWAALEPLTQLGRTLGEMGVTIDVPADAIV